MKIDRTKLKKSASEVPLECKVLIEKIKACTTYGRDSLLTELKLIKTWTYGKCELFHWADVLDIFDEILEEACKKETADKWVLLCDIPGSQLTELLLKVLQFTALLIEHSFTRHLYNSMEYLTVLLSSSDMTIVLGVLNLLYVFSKRSNFITRLAPEKKKGLVVRLTHLAESWGGKENGFGLAECCQELPASSFPLSATTLHFEYYAEQKDETAKKTSVLSNIHMEGLDALPKLPSTIMEELLVVHKVPLKQQMLLFTHIRLAQAFSSYEKRLQCVQGRLQAISVLVYSNAMQENVNTLLYSGLIEELVDTLELKDDNLMEIKATALRTLTSIIHLDRNPKSALRLNNIIDATGAALYHGFLPSLVRNCIQRMTDDALTPFPQPFATALFSFLYHLASYENGGEALVSCGMMESLLRVINWFGDGQEHITFVTRAVRVVDLITNLDMQAFQSHGGLNAFISRLHHEVEICRKEQPFIIRPKRTDSTSMDLQPLSPDSFSPMETETDSKDSAGPSTSDTDSAVASNVTFAKAPQCFPQRGALLKSMLNFLKKAIPDPAFSNSIRHLMDGSLPRSLKHLISNAEYYNPSLFLLATDVVTVYVFQEPSMLSPLQDNGLTDVVLQALLVKDVPPTREVLASLPNVFSALCLNNRGLEAFVACKPFERLFKVLLSADYLPAMRRRRSSDPPGDTASSLGNAMDELIRHHPSLRTEATSAIIKLLKEVCSMGRDPKFVCQKSLPKTEPSPSMNQGNQANDAVSSEDEDNDEDLAPVHKDGEDGTSSQDGSAMNESSKERTAIPLMDYVINVMKFVEAILSNNTTDDHCREFIQQDGLQPLMEILALPNLPIDFPLSPSCQAVAVVAKSILTLSYDGAVLQTGLTTLMEILKRLEPLHVFLGPPGGSVLMRELADSQGGTDDPLLTAEMTPLLHSLSSVYAFISMFTHVCKGGQSDMRSISVSQWGSELGLECLRMLSKLYTSIVWESTVLLALCSEDIISTDMDFARAELEKLITKEDKARVERDMEMAATARREQEAVLRRSTGDLSSNGVSQAMQSLSTSDTIPMDTTEATKDLVKPTRPEAKMKMSPMRQQQVKHIKPLLSSSSRLGRALAELFGLLVKLCVGSPVRQRRIQQIQPSPTLPSENAQNIASHLTKLLKDGLIWEPPPYTPVPKLRLTFFICSVGFTSPMLFDEKKNPYHLMLQKFIASGGQEALFEAFEWANSNGFKLPSMESTELPEGTGEFLDSWLVLVEKLVNPKAMLESPHGMPKVAPPNVRNYKPFNALHCLVDMQRETFYALRKWLWNRTPNKIFGARISESLLSILCHIIKGEPLIREKLEKEQEELTKTSCATQATTTSTAPRAAAAAATSTTSMSSSSSGSADSAPSAAASREPEANQEHLQQLMDMGFSREHCLDALNHTSNLEQATEYILTHPPPLPGISTSSLGALSSLPRSSGLMSNDEQLMRAIALSMGQQMDRSLGASSDTLDIQLPIQETSKTAEVKEPEEESAPKEPLPLQKEEIDDFTKTMIPGCLHLLDHLPETVFRICDLIVVVLNREGAITSEQVLTALGVEIADLSLQLVEATTPLATHDRQSIRDWAAQVVIMPQAGKLAVRLHLLALLFEVKELKGTAAHVIQASRLMDLLVRLLESGQRCLMIAKEAGFIVSSPKWLGPLLLLLDLYERMAVVTTRKADLEQLMGKNRSWKWFDDRSGKWSNYGALNNKTIDDAYRAGESSIRFTAGRRRYTVHFTTMVQVNEETANRRPIMLSLPAKDEKIETDDPSSDSNMETDNKKKNDVVVIQGLHQDLLRSAVSACVGLISLPADPDTLHATLRLVLRLTRDYQQAAHFSELGGLKLLLNLSQASAFQGFHSIVTLIFRHVMEEEFMLQHTMEKVIRSSCMGNGSSMCGVTPESVGAKELHYVLRVLAPAAARNPKMFLEMAQQTLRVMLPPPAKVDETDSVITNPTAPQLLKCEPSKQTTSYTLSNHARTVIVDLLTALTSPYDFAEEDAATKPTTNLGEFIDEVVDDLLDRNAQTAAASAVPTTAAIQPAATATASVTAVPPVTAGSSEEKKDDVPKKIKVKPKIRPLMPKSSILRLLAETIRSYVGCAQLVSSHTYPIKERSLVTEEGLPALSFMLDFLLPQCQTAGDKDCPALTRVVIASIAACNYYPEAQTALAVEVKAALQRALLLSESEEKHQRLQSLTAIISTVIEACPVPGQLPNQVFKSQQQNTMNNMVKILLKKGIVIDLARIPHSLDLSSPHMANTINSALKPLETLSRIVNQPQSMPAKGKQKMQDSARTFVDAYTALSAQQDNLGNEASEAAASSEAQNNNEGDATLDVRDNDLTLDDLPRQASNRVGDADYTPRQQQRLNALEAALDELLDRGSNRDTHAETQVLGEIIMESGRSAEDDSNVVVVDDSMVEVEDIHDSQMITQDISDDDDDDVQRRTSNSIMDRDHYEDDDDDDDNDDDERDEDEEDDVVDDCGEEEDVDDDDDDEDDEGSDMDQDEEGFRDMDDDTFYRLEEEDDLLVTLEEVLPMGSNMVWESATGPIRSFSLPVAVHDSDNVNEMSGPSLPPPPTHVSSAHPLLTRHTEVHSMGSSVASRVHRTGRRGGTYRYNPSTQTLHVHYAGLRQPPSQLQRLLGAGNADVLQLPLGGNNAGTRLHFFTNDDLRFMPRSDEDLMDDAFHESFDGDAMTSGVLSSVPAAITRWTEESRVLDGDSMHDCMTLLKPQIIAHLEKLRDAEIALIKEARKKEKASSEANADQSKVHPIRKLFGKTNVLQAPDGNSTMEGVVENVPAVSRAADSDTTSSTLMNASAGGSGIDLGSRGLSEQEQAAAQCLADAFATAAVGEPAGSSSNTELLSTPAPTTAASALPFITPNQPVPFSVPPAPFRSDQVGSNPEGMQISGVPLGESNTDDSLWRPEAEDRSQDASFLFSLLPEQRGATVIEPDMPSDITSSDAVTINSSGCSSENPSVAELSTPGENTPAEESTPQAAAPLSAEEAQPSQGTSSGATGSSDGDGLPDGVDPSFLAALPDNIRQEVIAEQLRLQRIQQRALQQQEQAANLGVSEVNPEFLAALPPNIQEEVLAQQRAEQARLQATTTAPETSLDPGNFIQSLPPSLRQQVLADMDDSMVAVLPPELATEAGTLRREVEERHRRLTQERLFAQGAGLLSGILRQSTLSNRIGRGASGFAIRPTGAAARGGPSSAHWPFRSLLAMSQKPGSCTAANTMRLRGRHLLDHEALTCLLVLLFVDEPRLNTSRLHRVFRNLCYHGPTRAWVIRALLSILQRTGECKKDEKKKRSEAPCTPRTVSPSWLSVSLDAALGCRANVFQIQRSERAKKASPSLVTIHPQASPVVCRHVLDTLISLAKSFPNQFLPRNNKVKEVACDEDRSKQSATTPTPGATPATPSSSSPSSSAVAVPTETDFWDLLVKLDHLGSKRGKSIPKAHHNHPTSDLEVLAATYDDAPIGQLMSMLAHPVVRRSQLLTDRLLRLLGLVSWALPENASTAASSTPSTTTTSTTASTTAGTSTTSVVTASPSVTCVASATSSSVTMVTASRGEVPVTCSNDSLGLSETMEMSSIPDDHLTSTPLPGKPAEPEKKEEVKEEEEEEEEGPVLETQLQLAVEVLTSKSCSEEGLEDATNLLLQLSRANNATRDMVLTLLLEGARQLGVTVCDHIRKILTELQSVTATNDADESPEDGPSTSSGQAKGVIADKFGAGVVVVHAPTKPKTSMGRELQLPSMQLLTNKTSSQQFLLRILKVIIQLRVAARQSVRRTNIMEMVRQNSTEDQRETPMDVDAGAAAPPVVQIAQVDYQNLLPRLSEQLKLDDLWDVLGSCLKDLSRTTDHHAVLVLQPAVEAFFILHAGEKDEKKKEQSGQRREDQLSHLDMHAPLSPATPSASGQQLQTSLLREDSVASVSGISNAHLPPDIQKFLKFAETHRTVLNQILRQSTTPLVDGPFSVLVDHTRVLDFDVKRRYFRQELDRLDEGMRREDLAIHVRRDNVFEDSFREMHRRTPEEWKHRFYIVFEGEEGQDAGGLLREWYIIISREIFNPMYALFCTSPGDRVTYTINQSSHCNSNHLSYFKFVGRIIAKAIYDNKLLECYFTRSFYKHILGVHVKYLDMESEDYAFYQGLVFLLENDIKDLGNDLSFSAEIQEFGVTEVRDLKPGGRDIIVTEENKKEYVKLLCQMKMTGAIRKQLDAFLEGFYDIIPKHLIGIFNEQELELLISGLPTIDIDDLKANTEYHKFQANSLQIQWFWRALRSFDQADRACFLQFVTGTSKVPLQGFAYLEGMNGIQKFQIHRDDRSTDRLPCAHTCFNQLDLPAYETYDKLHTQMMTAIHECSEGFGLA